MVVSRKKKFILVTTAILIVLAGLWGLDRLNVINLPLIPDNNKKSAEQGEINYGPPTEEEKQETEQVKEDLGNQNAGQQTTPTAQNGQKKAVTPIISSWGQTNGTGNIEVSGYVNGINEQGGTCTANLSKDNQTINVSKLATANAQNVSCGFVSVERIQLGPGTWSITLSYSSPTSEGTSQSVTLEVK